MSNSKSKQKCNSNQLMLFSNTSEPIRQPYGTAKARYKRKDTNEEEDLMPEFQSRNKYSPLSLMERKIIKKLIDQGYSLSFISTKIGRGKNSVVSEVRVNGGRDAYDPINAQRNANIKREDKYRKAAKTLKEKASNPNMYTHLKDKVDGLEMQIQILTNVIRGMKNENIQD